MSLPCSSPQSCRRLHCIVCTAHLAPSQQRFCSARCRARARSLRKQRLRCPHCGTEIWLPKRGAEQVLQPS